MKAAVVSCFDRARATRMYPTQPDRPRPDRRRRDRGRVAPPGAVAGRRIALHQHRRTAAGAGRRPRRRRSAPLFHPPGHDSGFEAEQTLVDTRRSIVLAEGSDPIAAAAGMNPAMSAWVALRRRIDFRAGQDVLILGATGNAGRMAVQVARHFGASRIVAAGRDRERLATLEALGATDTVHLSGDATAVADALARTAADVEVIIDYLWGEPAAAMAGVITARADRGKPLPWIQIGSVAGATSPIPSAALRAAKLQIVGSGRGSVQPRDILAELGAIADQISKGSFIIDAKAVPLTDVESAWAAAATSQERIVITPPAS